MKDYSKRIKWGVRWLEVIDADRLDLQSGCRCVLGQLADYRGLESACGVPNYDSYADAHGLTDEDAIDRGFLLSIDEANDPEFDYYFQLTYQWGQIIDWLRRERASYTYEDCGTMPCACFHIFKDGLSVDTGGASFATEEDARRWAHENLMSVEEV